MHSRLRHHGDHGRGCNGIGGCNGDSADELGFGLAGAGCPLRGSRNYSGREGDRLGWGREGRGRLDDSLTRPRRLGSMGGLLNEPGGLDLGRGGIGGGSFGGRGGSLDGMDGLGGLGGVRRWAPFGSGSFDRLDGRGSPPFRRIDDFVHPYDTASDQYLLDLREIGLGGMGGQGRLGGRPLLPGGLGTGLGGGLGGRSRTPSSNYSFDHLDRRPRPYHYQPPYVEDWGSILEEELLGQEVLGMLDRRGGMMQDRDLYGYGLPGAYDIDDLTGGMGGLALSRRIGRL